MTEEQYGRAAELAERILKTSQNTLLLNLRFLDSAIFRLSPKEAETTLATDGRYIYYGVYHILKRYHNEPAKVVRDVLHIVLHCVFRHSFVRPPINTYIWDLAADIAVENIISSLGISSVCTSSAEAQEKILNGLSEKLNSLNAEKIYRYYMGKGISPEEAAELRQAFMSDDHTCWYNPSEQQRLSGSGQGQDQSRSQNEDSNGEGGNGNESADAENENSGAGGQNNSQSGSSDDNGGSGGARSELEEEWERVSKQIQTDMETFSRQQGYAAGSMTQQLRELNRERYNYDVFLKKFAVMGEVMKINDDEFDYIFYTYGLSLYGNVPLIEPLEYKEEKRVREFVVAIDTSGSTSGELVQRFLEKTYNILKNTESFFSKINLHIIQCDAAIQEHVKITTQEEFDNYIRSLEIKGLGGTDFRPVFRLVDKMIAEKEFQHLKGIIYFTDGYGTFPEKKPDYETAFVFIRNEYDNPGVPPWAIKLVLNDEEI